MTVQVMRFILNRYMGGIDVTAEFIRYFCIDFLKDDKYNLLMLLKIFIKEFIGIAFLCNMFFTTFLFATDTEECYFNSAYFNATYINNYGGDERAENFVKDAIKVTNVVIRLDSLIKSNVRRGLIKNYLQYKLIDNYAGNFRIPKESYIKNGKEIHLRLTDSIAVNKILKDLWGIKDYTISPNVTAGIWLFSLHIGVCKTKNGILALIEGLDINYDRPDEEFLWLKVEGGLYSPMSFYQYEKDGFYHGYTGLYLTKNSVMRAKKLIEKRYGIKTAVTSHYITPSVLKKYVIYTHNE